MEEIAKLFLGNLVENKVGFRVLIDGLNELYKTHHNIDIFPFIEDKFKSMLLDQTDRPISAKDELLVLEMVRDIEKIYSLNLSRATHSHVQKIESSKNLSVNQETNSINQYDQVAPVLQEAQQEPHKSKPKYELEYEREQEFIYEPINPNKQLFIDHEMPLPTVEKIANDFTWRNSELARLKNQNSSVAAKPKTDSEWATEAAKSGLSRFGASIKLPKLSPAHRRRTVSNRPETTSSFNGNADGSNPKTGSAYKKLVKSEDEYTTQEINSKEFQSIIKERDDLQAEFEKLRSKNLIIQRELELRSAECYEAQKKLNDVSYNDKQELQQLQNKLEQFALRQSNQQEKDQMEDEVKRLALKVSNSEAQKHKLQRKLTAQSQNLEKLQSQIKAIEEEKYLLEAKLSQQTSEKMKIEKSATAAISKNLEISSKLQDAQFINQKLEESQMFVKQYEEKIDRLLIELESSKQQLEYYTNNPNAHTPDLVDQDILDQSQPQFQPQALNGSQSEKSNTEISHQLYLNGSNSKILFDLFSNCLPNEFAFISSCWKLIDKQLASSNASQTRINNETNSATSIEKEKKADNFTSELAASLLKSDFIRVLHLYLSNDNQTGTFYSFLLRSKNSKLLSVLKPSIDQYKAKASKEASLSHFSSQSANELSTGSTSSASASSRNTLRLRNNSSNQPTSEKPRPAGPGLNTGQANDSWTIRLLLSVLILATFFNLARVFFPSSSTTFLPSWLTGEGGLLNQNSRELINDADLDIDASNSETQIANRYTMSNLYGSVAGGGVYEGDAPLYVNSHSIVHFKHGRSLLSYLLNKFRINGWEADGADYPT